MVLSKRSFVPDHQLLFLLNCFSGVKLTILYLVGITEHSVSAGGPDFPLFLFFKYFLEHFHVDLDFLFSSMGD